MHFENTLWYEQPAKNWNEALPVGNGILGAMIFGGVKRERIQLNEDSLWSGVFTDRNNPDCLGSLEEIRSLIKQGKVNEAERLARFTMTGIPEGQRAYQTLGDISIEMDIKGKNHTGYRRELDLSRAVCTTSFQIDNATYKREVFASNPHKVIVIRLSAVGAKMNFNVKMGRGRFMNRSWAENGDTIAYDGGSGLSFCCMMRATAKGGSLSTKGEYLIAKDVEEATLFISAATSFRHDDQIAYCRQTLEEAIKCEYDSILQKHIEDYSAYFNRSILALPSENETKNLPTDKRLACYSENQNDNGLIALYYQFGRYLLISCSRPGSLPANLQGIWCDSITPPWDSKYTININTEMNYWLAEVCNLSECHFPLFDLLERMYPNGRDTAKKMYGANGWLAHHNTDIWGDTAPQDTYIPATYWVMGAAWLCTHIWKHYEYTLDKEFLQQYFYLIKESCVFFVEYLAENEKGFLVITPTVSPENTYKFPGGDIGCLCEGSAMDSQILMDLFGSCIKACGILETESELCEKLTKMLAKIPPIQTGKDGRIMEWTEEYEEMEPGHRHISHLYALFPGDQISVQKTPDLATAAQKTLDYRLASGGGHTGWSRAWIINFWASLHNGDKTQENIEQLLCKSTLPNLFDNHPPFQIDGNFGGTAGIANSLMQSFPDSIVILPALPSACTKGSITGLKGKGGITVDITWDNGKPTLINISAQHVYEGTIRYGDTVQNLSITAGEMVTVSF